MVQVLLKRSGGFAGISMQSSGTLDYDLSKLLDEIKNARPASSVMHRDAFTYSLIIDTNIFPIDPDKLKGKLKTEIQSLTKQLSPLK